jgi:allantoate deiminase
MSEMKAGIAEQPTASLGDEIVDRINELGAISETPEHLARVFLSQEHRAAADLILGWMRSAGMDAMKASGLDCLA